MPAEWKRVPGKRVKGYTKKDGTRVKGYIRKRPAPRVKAVNSVAEIRVARIGIAIYRKRNDAEFLGEISRDVLNDVASELAKTLGAKRLDIDSVWRCDVKIPTMSVGDLISKLVEVEDVDLQGGKVGLGVYLKVQGREIFVPFAKARYSLTESAVEGAETLLKQILKYLPELGAVEEDEDDDDLPPDPIEAFARRSAAARKGHATRKKNKAKKAKKKKKAKGKK
jgi:Asp-tRNA(Asn)/Glu-tRNA(Gln) amidotransferase C subunit